MKEIIHDYNILALIEELENNIKEYDQADDESDIALFSEYDPLKNLKLSLAQKLSSSTNKPLLETEIEARKLVEQIKQEIEKSNSKKRICSILKSLAEDCSNLSISIVGSVIATLATGGAITLPLVPALPGISVAVASLILARAGITFFCANVNE